MWHINNALSFTPGSCQGKTSDILFILDASSSVWPPHFRQQVKFVRHVAHVFDIGQSKSRVAVMTFASGVRLDFGLRKYGDRNGVMKGIDRIQQLFGGTRTDLALGLAAEIFQGKECFIFLKALNIWWSKRLWFAYRNPEKIERQ